MDTTEKPPLGVMPKSIWLEKRAIELSEAIDKRLKYGKFDEVASKWVDELREIILMFGNM